MWGNMIKYAKDEVDDQHLPFPRIILMARETLAIECKFRIIDAITLLGHTIGLEFFPSSY